MKLIPLYSTYSHDIGNYKYSIWSAVTYDFSTPRSVFGVEDFNMRVYLKLARMGLVYLQSQSKGWYISEIDYDTLRKEFYT